MKHDKDQLDLFAGLPIDRRLPSEKTAAGRYLTPSLLMAINDAPQPATVTVPADRWYLVDVHHVRDVEQWTKTDHRFRVRGIAYRFPGDADSGLYVDAAEFGCSRTYNTDSPHSAIAYFLNEHACTPHNIREVTSDAA